MGTGSIQLGRIFGIRIGASPSWFVVVFIMIISLTSTYRGDFGQSTAFGIAVASAVLFFGSLTLHELGHALVARRNGIQISGIELWFFGGIAKLDRDSRSPGEEFRVAVAGPAVNALIIAACYVIGVVLSDLGRFNDIVSLNRSDQSALLTLIGWVALVNAILLVFNLIPAFPLDGGRIARAVAWSVTGDRNRGTRFSARLGQIFSYVLIGSGIFLLLRSDAFTGLWFIVLGWFLGRAATGAVANSLVSERLEGVTVADVMDTQPVWVPASTTVREAQDEFFLRYRWSWFPVADAHSGRFLGLLRQERVDSAVESGQPAISVAEVLDGGRDAAYRVRDNTPIEELLRSEGLETLGALMVVDGEQRLRGVVTREQVVRAFASTVAASR